MKKTETKSTVLLQHHLKTLKLPTMLAEHEKVAARCAADNADHLAFLLQLCELELIDVISTAYERNSLIVTTNLPFENWTEVLSSERLTGATLDRLTHRCHILEASGESYRLRDAKRRKRPVRSSRVDTKTKQERPTPGHETPVTLNQDTTTNTALCYPTAPRFAFSPPYARSFRSSSHRR